MNQIDRTLRSEEKVSLALRGLYDSYGYRQFRMGKFEEYDLYVRNKSFLVSDNVITFTDTDGRLMALKPDVTLSIVKNTKDAPGVRKVYYNENVYRPAGDSRNFREIMQAGLECIGQVDNYCLSEVLTLAARSLEAISPEYALDVSDLGMLSRAVDALGAPAELRSEIICRIGEKNLHDIAGLCASLGLPAANAAPLRALLGCPAEPEKALPLLGSLFDDAEWKMLTDRFAAVLAPLAGKRVRVDFSVTNDISYYNGIVFQGFVRGVPEAVLSGGQYDNLLRRMHRSSSAVGFAVYLDRIGFLAPPADEYDVDTLLLYTEDADPAALAAAVARLAAEGSVCAARAIPEKFTFRRALTFTESGVREK